MKVQLRPMGSRRTLRKGDAMRRESFEALIARVNAGGFIPKGEPTANPLANKRSRTMAKVVKLKKGEEFHFGGSGAQTSKYPWSQWLDGQLWHLEKGVDFDVDVLMMQGKVRSASRKRYKITQISTRDQNKVKLTDGIIIRARDMDAAERAKEDEQRAKEEIKNKERREKQKAEAKAAKLNGQANPTPAPATAPSDGSTPPSP